MYIVSRSSRQFVGPGRRRGAPPSRYPNVGPDHRVGTGDWDGNSGLRGRAGKSRQDPTLWRPAVFVVHVCTCQGHAWMLQDGTHGKAAARPVKFGQVFDAVSRIQHSSMGSKIWPSAGYPLGSTVYFGNEREPVSPRSCSFKDEKNHWKLCLFNAPGPFPSQPSHPC